jgi:hypothetical protein
MFFKFLALTQLFSLGSIEYCTQQNSLLLSMIRIKGSFHVLDGMRQGDPLSSFTPHILGVPIFKGKPES